MTDFGREPELAARYRIEGEAGRGGMATVYRAWDTRHQRFVAIKVLHPELASSIGRDRFTREISIAAQLHHPHIVPLYDSGETNGQLYYVMPYLEGESLRERLRREGQLPAEEARRLAREVADALSYAHAKGLVHRDIKPENILIESGHAVVSDFGIARAIEAAGGSALTGTGTVIGTPAYMSPEQASGDEPVDGRSDVYSLGCVLFEMLTGKPPFDGPTARAVIAAHLSEAPAPLGRVRADVPPALALAVAGALAKDPAHRTASAETFRAMLDAGAPPVARRRWDRRIAWAIVTLVVAIVAGTAVLTRRSAPGLDPNLVAVAPFSTLDPRLALWREGLVDLLSRNLDGAGPLKTVAPTLVIRRWHGQDDKASGAELARATGARLVVFGNLFATGADSARLTAVLFDVRRNEELAEIDLRDDVNHVDRLADSLTLRILRTLGQTSGLEAFRTSSSSFHSLAALKAFLQGEQWFRKTAWDSAEVAFRRAAALDTASPLPPFRLSEVRGWAYGLEDEEWQAFALRAGSLNHGLPPRDSLQVAFDSITASLAREFPMMSFAEARRLHAIAEELSVRYPDDAASWNDLGEAAFHFGSIYGAHQEDALAGFDHAIRLDSSFAPAYIHPIAIAYERDGPAGARRYLAPYLARGSNGTFESGLTLVSRLVDTAVNPDAAARLLAAEPLDHLGIAWGTTDRGDDSAAWDLAIARAQITRSPPGAPRTPLLAFSLLFHGRLDEGTPELIARGGAAVPNQWLFDAALLHAGPLPALDSVFAGWFKLPGPPRLFVVGALSVFAARADSSAILQTLRVCENPGPLPEAAWSDLAKYGVASAQAYLTLVRGDTTKAIRLFETLPDTLFPVTYAERLKLAALYSARHEDQKAEALLERRLADFPAPAQVLWRLLHARTEERLGRKDDARRDFGYVANVWAHADPDLSGYVREAKAGLARLSGEPRP